MRETSRILLKVAMLTLFVLFLIYAFFFSLSKADQPRRVLRQDVISSDRMNVYDRGGRPLGYWKKDILSGDWRRYGNKGERRFLREHRVPGKKRVVPAERGEHPQWKER